ncbi:MAG TPA: biotin/lipoyl-containing protein [Candidatus Baltobacteraceae bacterium]
MDEKQTLEELLAIMHEHDLDKIKVKVGDALYELVRREPGSYVGPPVPASAHGVAPAAGPPTAAPPNVKKVAAPLTGVFYRSPSPDEPSFVNVGDRVEVGAPLCILEAMKLFNEIVSDYAGTVLRVLPENGELVSQGDDIVWIEP